MTITYDIELVPAKLVPFDWSAAGANSLSTSTTAVPIQTNSASGVTVSPSGQTISADDQNLVDYQTTAAGLGIGYSPQASADASPNGLSLSGGSIYDASHPLYPLTLTGGLVFPYNPTISESLGTKYDATELVHANENIHTYKNTENVRITLSECIWTSETWDQAIYTLGVIHFFRSYRLMDFGRGKSGRPPSPMWFSAYGAFLYNALPVLIERVDFAFPADVDYVGVPNPGTTNYNQQQLTYSTSASTNITQSFLSQTGDYTWIPIKFTISSISMVVQNAVAYWTNRFDLADFKAGKLVGRT
jgi:hypothetical protein